MHLASLSDDNPADDNSADGRLADDNSCDCTLIGALRRMQYALIAALLAIATVCVINGLAT